MRFLGRSITLDDHAPALLLLRIVLFLENLVPVAFFFVGVVGLPLEDFESSPGQSICGSFCAPGGSNNRRPKNGILPPVWFKLQALSVPNRSAHVCKQRNRDHCRIAPHALRCCFHKSPHVFGDVLFRRSTRSRRWSRSPSAQVLLGSLHHTGRRRLAFW